MRDWTDGFLAGAMVEMNQEIEVMDRQIGLKEMKARFSDDMKRRREQFLKKIRELDKI